MNQPILTIIPLFLFLSCSAVKTAPVALLDTKRGTDFHMHIHSPPKEYDDLQFNGERSLLAVDSIGLSRALVLSNSYSKNVAESYAQTENNFVHSEVVKNPGRLAGACAINPAKNWAYKELKRCASLGFKILKLHLMASGMDLKKETDYKIAKDIIFEASNLNFTILIHANYPKKHRGEEILKLKELLEEFPKTRWIIGHLFGKEHQHLKQIKLTNFVVEISAAPFFMRTELDKNQLAETMRSVGMNHFVFGSDWPVLHPAEMLKSLKALPLTENEIQMILFENPKQLDDLFI